MRLAIYNISGQLVKNLKVADLPAGQQIVTWHGENNVGLRVTSGVYLVQLKFTAGGQTRTVSRKMVLLQ